MSVTAKDFIAEASDIADYLTPHIPAPALATYVQQRCATLYSSNALFDRDRFTSMAYGLTETSSLHDEITGHGLSRVDALEQILTLRTVLDMNRVVPTGVQMHRDFGADDNVAYSYTLRWKGDKRLSESMHTTHIAIRGSRHE